MRPIAGETELCGAGKMQLIVPVGSIFMKLMILLILSTIFIIRNLLVPNWLS